MKTATGLEYVGQNISMPKRVWQEIDELAEKLQLNRSAVVRQIYREWKVRQNCQNSQDLPNDLAIAL